MATDKEIENVVLGIVTVIAIFALIVLIFMLIATSIASADDGFGKWTNHRNEIIATPTLPGTSFKDYRSPSYIRQGDNVYPTIPGTSLNNWRANK